VLQDDVRTDLRSVSAGLARTKVRSQRRAPCPQPL